MKILSRILSVLAIAGLAFFNTGCGSKGGDSDPVEKIQLAKLSTTWKIASVTDGVTASRLSDFTGFTLTISGSFNTTDAKGPYQYTVSGKRPNPNPWPAVGTWKFGADAQKDLVRVEDNIAMNYTVTDTQLTLSFTYAGDGYAGSSRVNNVSGNWVFTFTK